MSDQTAATALDLSVTRVPGIMPTVPSVPGIPGIMPTVPSVPGVMPTVPSVPSVVSTIPSVVPTIAPTIAPAIPPTVGHLGFGTVAFGAKVLPSLFDDVIQGGVSRFKVHRCVGTDIGVRITDAQHSRRSKANAENL